MIDPADSPMVLPPGYRIVYRFFLLPVRVAGERRCCETLRVIQRITRNPTYTQGYNYAEEWEDVGFYDEVFPTLRKRALHDRDWEAAE